jgi:uncharacterized protein (TIGR03435 family)
MRFIPGLLCAAALLAQTPSFEVASVKPHPGISNSSRWGVVDSGRFEVQNMPVHRLIEYAWDLQESQVTGGPGWLGSDLWDITAKPEAPIADTPEGEALARAMLRNLLIERFQLKMHTEQRPATVYVLVVSKAGAKLRTAASADASAPSNWNEGSFTSKSATLDRLARALSDILQRPVSDETHIAGAFNIALRFAPADDAKSNRPSIFTAVEQQLGLHLESRRAPVGTLVIDSAARPSEN